MLQSHLSSPADVCAHVSLLEERIRTPLHQGIMHDADAKGAVGNPACGDVVTVYLRIRDGRIEAASFESIGSAYQLATASVLCDCIAGQTVDEASARGPNCVLKRLPDLPTNKRYLARLAIDALQRAFADHAARQAGGATRVEGRRPVEGDEAESFVLGLLANGRPWGTQEILAMAAADRVKLPSPVARFLAGLRRRGIIEGQMDPATRSWRWRAGGQSLDEPRHAGDQQK